MAQFRDACLSAARMFGWDGKPSITYYGDDNRTLVVCDEARRRELIEQRQRLLEAESQGKVIELNGHKAKAAGLLPFRRQKRNLRPTWARGTAL